MGKLWYTDSQGKRHQTEEGYKHSYEKWHGTSRYKAERSARNSARRSAIKSGRVQKGSDMDVHHPNGVSDNKHTRVISSSANRSIHEKSRKRGSSRNKARWGK